MHTYLLTTTADNEILCRTLTSRKGHIGKSKKTHARMHPNQCAVWEHGRRNHTKRIPAKILVADFPILFLFLFFSYLF